MMNFSKTEIRDIILATAALAFAFGGLNNFLVSLFVVGVAFLSHELIGHKLVAQHFGAEAEFKAWPLGLILAIVTSFFGFIFAAPGAVYFSARWAFQRENRKDVGLIGVAGIVFNLILFLGLTVAYFFTAIPILRFAAQINVWLAIFNLLPIPPLDGSKVFAWDIKIWAPIFALAVAGFFALTFLI